MARFDFPAGGGAAWSFSGFRAGVPNGSTRTHPSSGAYRRIVVPLGLWQAVPFEASLRHPLAVASIWLLPQNDETIGKLSRLTMSWERWCEAVRSTRSAAV